MPPVPYSDVLKFNTAHDSKGRFTRGLNKVVDTLEAVVETKPGNWLAEAFFHFKTKPPADLEKFRNSQAIGQLFGVRPTLPVGMHVPLPRR